MCKLTAKENFTSLKNGRNDNKIMTTDDNIRIT